MNHAASSSTTFCYCILQLLVKDSKDGTVPYGKISQSQFEELMSLYSIRSRVEPGDAVGILAAQVCVVLGILCFLFCIGVNSPLLIGRQSVYSGHVLSLLFVPP